MASGVDFLRIKWPRLAALGNEAESLLEVSPTGAIDSMQTFCLWALDIIADMFNINLPADLNPLEKLDVIDATEKVPTEILNKFAIIFTGGCTTAYRINISQNEAQTCFEHMVDIGYWMKKEADKNYQMYEPYVSNGSGNSGFSGDNDFTFTKDRIIEFYQKYKQYILIALIAIVVVVGGILIAHAIAKGGANKVPEVVPTETPVETATPVVLATPTPQPTSRPETFKALQDLTPTNDTSKFMAKGSWTFNTLSGPFYIEDTEYSSGIGMFVASSTISDQQGTNKLNYLLEKKYTALRFDLGAHSKRDYSENCGTYDLTIYAENTDSTPLYDSGWLSYNQTAMNVEVDVTGVDTLIICLTEKKGTGGTLNIVLGNARLVEAYLDEPAATSAAPAVTDQPVEQPTEEPATAATAGMAVPTPPIATPNPD